MPNQSQHQIKAKSNRSFLSQIDCSTSPDWAAVVAFYTAVHLIERLRAMASQHSNNHQDRLQFVQTSHRGIHYEFHELYNLSIIARYESNKQFFDRVTSDEVTSTVIGDWLAAVENYVEQLVKK